jgi:ACS family tartrate transporter-like MFS transporter
MMYRCIRECYLDGNWKELARMTASHEISEPERRTLAKVKRNMLIYIISGQVLYQLDRTNIGFAQLTMGKDLALTAQAFGLASGIFAFSAFLMQVPASLLFEKLGARRWLTSIMVAWGLVVVCQAFVTNAFELTVLRFLLGIFEAGFLPGLYVLISVWFRGKNHGVATSGIMLGLAISGVLGGPFAGWILDRTFLGLAGWRSLFLIEGGLTVIWALVALLVVNDGPEKTSWLKPEEREFMVKYLSEYQAEKAAHGAVEKSTFWGALKDVRIITLILSYFCAGWVAATFTFFIPTLLKRAGTGLDNQTVGLLVMGPYLLQAVVSFTWGAHADRTERHWHCVLPLLVSAAGILLYPLATLPFFAMLCMSTVEAGKVGFFVNFWPTCHMVVGKKTIAKTTALINSGTQAGSFVAPVFFGWAMDVTGNTNLGMYTCVGVLLLNFAIMNVFFFRYKAQVKKNAAAVAAA